MNNLAEVIDDAVEPVQPYLAMAQAVYYPQEDSVELVADEPVNPSQLEKIASENGIPRRAARDLGKGAESINYSDRQYEGFLKSGELQALSKCLPKSYQNIPKIRYRAASNRQKDAAAYTTRRDLVGVNTDFRDKAKSIAKDAGIDQRTAELFIFYHEDVHRGQPDKIRENPLVAEADAEFNVAKSFYNASLRMKGERAKQYRNAAEYAFSRYIARGSQALDMTPEQFVSALSRYSRSKK